ncbi:MAG: MGMT family protein [Bacteriovoracaceae bacterium]|nr:MGMT family protein [Bacteriovoracaceae bacterium]
MKEQSMSAVLPKLPIVGHLKLTSYDGKTLAMVEVVKNKSSKITGPFFQKSLEEFEQFLSGKSRAINIKLDYSRLSPFQVKVLKVMKEIPYGEVATYKELAEKLDSKAYQAIGSACGKNPFLLIYPCHRVVGSNDIGGFAHGITMKKELLKLEGRSGF